MHINHSTPTTDRFGDTDRSLDIPEGKQKFLIVYAHDDDEKKTMKTRLCCIAVGKPQNLAGMISNFKYENEHPLKWLAKLAKAAGAMRGDNEKGAWGVEAADLIGKTIYADVQHRDDDKDPTKKFVSTKFGNFTPWEPEGDELALVNEWRAMNAAKGGAGGAGEPVGAGAPAAAAAGLPF